MSRSSCLLHACTVDAMRGKPDVGNFPACGSPELVTPGLRRRRAYRRAYVSSPRLTTTDVGLMPRLAYARVVHTAPDWFFLSGTGSPWWFRTNCHETVCVCVCVRSVSNSWYLWWNWHTWWYTDSVSDHLPRHSIFLVLQEVVNSQWKVCCVASTLRRAHVLCRSRTSCRPWRLTPRSSCLCRRWSRQTSPCRCSRPPRRRAWHS